MEDNRSLAEIVNSLPEEERAAYFEGFTEEDYAALEYDADFWLRPKQRIEDGDWFMTAVVAGRGFGKTRMVSEWVRRKARENPGSRFGLGGRTAADVRNILVLGESGILAVSPEDEKPEYKQHMSMLVWPNGSTAQLLTSESPDQSRGVQFHFSCFEELGSFKTSVDSSGATLYSNLITATRLGDNPQILAATTPRRTPLMKDLFERSKDPRQKIRIIRGSTLENSALSKSYIENLLLQYGDTDLARQEIEGMMLEDAEGIVFTDDMISRSKIYGEGPSLSKLWKFVAVDPSVSADPKTADECGIMVVGVTREVDPLRRTAYIIEDASLRANPDDWSTRVIDMCKKYNTSHVIAEKNQGGALITSVLKAKSNDVKVHLVWATQGKIKRVEPVVVAMQQNRVKLLGDFPELEDQLLYYDPELSNFSPDRMDAMVWACFGGLVSQPKTMSFGTFQVQSPKHSKLAIGRSLDSLKSKGRIQLPPR